MTTRKRVLVAEADPLARLAIDGQLEALGWDVITVNNGREAIRVAVMGLQVDVLLTELLLPDLDGLTVARAVTRRSPGTHVVFMTSHLPSEPLEPCHAPVLVKPFSTFALAAALSGAIRLRRDYPRPV